MYIRNKQDQEAWLREKSIDSLKANTYLQENDIVQVAEDSNFYKVISEETEIPLQNNLYAQIMPSNLKGSVESANKLKTARTITLTGDTDGDCQFDGSTNVEINVNVKDNSHSHDNSTITGIDASKITSGTIDISRLPEAALERCIVVDNDEARFKLTKEQVQNGDSVKVTSPDNLMYIVVDDNKLNLEDGYIAYSAAVKWETIKDKPESFTPSAHTHKSSDVNALTGYTKQQSFNPIVDTDNLNTALGKLEVGLELPNIFNFNIDENGDLILNYNSTQAPDFKIEEDGCLYYNFPEGNKQNLGKVVGKDGSEIDLSSYQKKQDNSLTTNSKNIVGSINELNNKKMGNGILKDYQVTNANTNTTELNGITLKVINSAAQNKPRVDGSLGLITIAEERDWYAQLAVSWNTGKLFTRGSQGNNNINSQWIEYANVNDLNNKQNKTDNSLTTTSKEIVGAINELKTTTDGKLGKSDKASSSAIADKLSTARKINGIAFDGSQDITITKVSSSDKSIVADKLSNARKINNVAFDGSQDITITQVANATTSGSCTGNSATATKLATARQINGVAFDGSQNITITKVANATTSESCTGNAATANTAKSCTGNSATATKLATARKINGIAFDGSQDITITKVSSSDKSTTADKFTTARTINGVSFDGTKNIVVSDSTKLPLTGGTINGALTVTGDILSNGNVTAFSDRRLKGNIEPIENALEKVRQLQGITYNLIGDNKRQAGLIAQDVKEVLPEVVVENENGMLSLDYARIVALLINAINELDKKGDA